MSDRVSRSTWPSWLPLVRFMCEYSGCHAAYLPIVYETIEKYETHIRICSDRQTHTLTLTRSSLSFSDDNEQKNQKRKENEISAQQWMSPTDYTTPLHATFKITLKFLLFCLFSIFFSLWASSSSVPYHFVAYAMRYCTVLQTVQCSLSVVDIHSQHAHCPSISKLCARCSTLKTPRWTTRFNVMVENPFNWINRRI